MQLRVGCSGWSYAEWVGPFYPKGAPPADFLRLYARAFDAVEVDSSFYGAPKPETVERWRAETPDGFTFCPKVPQELTGGVRAGPGAPAGAKETAPTEFVDVLATFLDAVDRLGPKLGPLVVQYPPSFARRGHTDDVDALLSGLAPRRAAVEFRHASWFEPATLALLRERGAALVWSQVQGVEVPPEATADFLLVRFIGDRSFEPQGRVEHPKDEALARWYARIKSRAGSIEQAFVFFNNHFEGFGPGSVNRFRELGGMPPVDFGRRLPAGRGAQARLGEF